MYYPYFIAYVLSGVTITLVVFFWALSRGQFKEQQRARYLPLEHMSDSAPIKPSRMGRIETYSLFFLALLGLATTASVLIFALLTR